MKNTNILMMVILISLDKNVFLSTEFQQSPLHPTPVPSPQHCQLHNKGQYTLSIDSRPQNK